MPERVHDISSMSGDAPRREHDAGAGAPPRGLERGIDALLAVQRPVVLAHLRSLRRGSPDASPERLVRLLERRYLAAVTTGGAAVGATAVVPGIGTGMTLALSGVETAGFLEATALFAQSVAEVHGIPVENPDRARALVMTLMLGREGSDLVRQFAGQATGTGVARNVYWGELITDTLPKAVMGTVVDRLRGVFIKQFAVRGGAGWIGKALPFGIGAAVGGVGNHVLGRRVLTQSRLAFGAAPAVLPAALEVADGSGPVRAVGRGIARAGSSIGRVAKASAGGIRAVGQAGGRAARSAVTRRGAAEPASEAPEENDGRADAAHGRTGADDEPSEAAARAD